MQAHILSIYVIFEPFLHIRECESSAKVGVEPVYNYNIMLGLTIPIQRLCIETGVGADFSSYLYDLITFSRYDVFWTYIL